MKPNELVEKKCCKLKSKLLKNVAKNVAGRIIILRKTSQVVKGRAANAET